MGKTQWNLASGGNIAGGGSSKMQPVTVSGGNAVRVSPRTIATGAAHVKNTPAMVPEIMVDGTAEAIGHATNTLVNAAFTYQDRKDELEADEAVLEFKRNARNAYLSDPDGNGSEQTGYATLRSKSALDAFGGYKEGINKLSADTLASRSPSVRAKMLIRVQQERNAAIDRGAVYNQQQFHAYESDVRAQQRQDILKDIELNGPGAFTNGSIADHLSKYDSVEERLSAEEYLSKQAMYKVFNNSIEAASKDTMNLTPSVTAYETTAAAFEKIRGTLSESSENALQNWLQDRRDQAEHQAKAAIREREERRTREIERSGPMNMANTLVSGNKELLAEAIPGYRSAFKNPSTASSKLVTSIKGAIEYAVKEQGGVTIADRRIAGTRFLDQIIKAGGPNLNPLELMELENYVAVDLPNAMAKQMDNADDELLVSRDLMIAKAKAEGKKLDLEAMPPPSMLPENQEKWFKQIDTYNNSIKGELTGYSPAKAAAELIIAQGKLLDGPLTSAEMKNIQRLSIEGSIPPGEYEKIHKANVAAKSNTMTKKPWQNTAGYTALSARIKSSAHMFAGNKPVKPKKMKGEAEKEYLDALADWKYKASFGEQQAKLEMDKAASLAHANKQEFDSEKWWADYVKKSVNKGSVISPQVKRGFFSSMWQEAKNVGSDAGETAGDWGNQILYDITGDAEYMPTGMD